MKTEIFLKREDKGCESKDDDSNLSESTSTEYEQYSPTDFIIQPGSKEPIKSIILPESVQPVDTATSLTSSSLRSPSSPSSSSSSTLSPGVGGAHHVVVSLGDMARSRSLSPGPGPGPSPQSVIRPIPILPGSPLDSSVVYSTPPTYIDTLPIVTLPMVPTQQLTLAGQGQGKGQRQESVIQKKQVNGHSPPKLYPASVNSGVEERMILDEGEQLRCQWMNCEDTFTVMEDLVNHVNDFHVRVERPDVEYQCKWNGCPRRGKGFNARYKMLIHIRTHTNEKPHQCSACGKSFSRLENLKIHNRSHTGEKPYSCPFEGCTKAYSNSSDRFKHVRTHQEDKPYICKMPGCNKRYTDPSSLRKHVRTHGHQCQSSRSSKKSEKNNLSISNSSQEMGTVMCMPGGMTKLCPLSPNTLLLPVSHHGSSLCLSSTFGAVGLESGGIGGVLHVPNLTANNPLLSSTVISVQPNVLNTQTDMGVGGGVNGSVRVSGRENGKMPNSIVGDGVKGLGGSRGLEGEGPDSPLDLSTGPSSPAVIISSQDVEMGTSAHGIVNEGSQWEIIQTET